MEVFICKGYSGRELRTWTFENCTLHGKDLYYPNVHILSNNQLWFPLNEKTMSLGETTQPSINFEVAGQTVNHELNPVFFFVYNTENYFHFLYDTLPILYNFFKLRTEFPSMKLLMNQSKNYQFVMDSLKLLGIQESEIVIASNCCKYKSLYVSSSLTHDGQSNDPPHQGIWTVYNKMKYESMKTQSETPRKLYISRRTWIHGDTSNIGTNYTTRRKMVNEDQLVLLLTNQGYTEVFCELLSMAEKIRYFANATHIVGAIGGGMCNVVFSDNKCNVLSINSPEFIKINKRFLYTMNHTQIKHYNVTRVTSNLYKRVKLSDCVGEVIEEVCDGVIVNIGKGNVGWNLDEIYEKRLIKSNDIVYLDNGLNSPWECIILDLLTQTPFGGQCALPLAPEPTV